jgi:hypothetical protein
MIKSIIQKQLIKPIYSLSRRTVFKFKQLPNNNNISKYYTTQTNINKQLLNSTSPTSSPTSTSTSTSTANININHINMSTTNYKGSELELECINTIRAVSADMVQTANSGHPGAPMGCAPIAYLLWNEIMNYSPKSPKWINRDRFVLSNGHACALQYVMLHLTGYADSKINDLKQFRQLGSTTPGHPECFVTSGTFYVLYIQQTENWIRNWETSTRLPSSVFRHCRSS